MALTTRNARLAAILTGIAVAGALAPGAAASADGNSAPRERLYVNPSTGYATAAPPAGGTVHVNPSTGYATAAPPAGGTVHVNPSTGFASVEERPASNPASASRPIEPAPSADAAGGFDWASAGIGAAAGAGLVFALMLSLANLGVGGLTRVARTS